MIVVYLLRYRVNTIFLSRHVLAVVLFSESQFTHRKSQLRHPTGVQEEQGWKLASLEQVLPVALTDDWYLRNLTSR